jgi:hypothetical protein
MCSEIEWEGTSNSCLSTPILNGVNTLCALVCVVYIFVSWERQLVKTMAPYVPYNNHAPMVI